MGKVLVFKDGNSITFTDNSTITDLQTVVANYAGVDGLRVEFTEENMSEVTFDNVVTKDLLPVCSTANANAEGNVTVHFINKFKADKEIQDLKAQVAELETQNQELINENEQLSDKAEAADILLGNEEV